MPLPPAIDKKAAILLTGIPFFWNLIDNPFLSDSPEYNTHHYTSWYLTVGAIVIIFIGYFVKQTRCTFTTIDILLIGFVLCLLFSNIGKGLNETLENAIPVIGLYGCCRCWLIGDKGTKNVFLLLAISAGFEMLIAVGQIGRFATTGSDDLALAITGTVGNSGILAGYCVIGSPFIFYFARQSLFYRGLVAAIIIVIIGVTRSRSAALSFLLIIVLLYAKPLLARAKQIPTAKKIAIGGVATIIGILFCIYSYQAKIGSAAGRLLIWKISFAHVHESPISGVGYGDFSRRYFFWQADYFATHPQLQSSEGRWAGEPSTAFNDPLELLLETGVIGFAFFVLLNYAAITSGNTSQNKYLRAAIAGFLVFSLFSYPMHSLPLFSTYLLSLVTLSQYAPTIGAGRLHNWQRVLGVCGLACLTPCLFFLAWKKNEAMHNWVEAGTLRGIDNKRAIDTYQKTYSQLNKIPLFQYQFGELLYDDQDYAKSAAILEENKENIAGIKTLLLLGKDYMQLHQFEKAGDNFKLAAQFLPYNFEAKYWLARLYEQEGRLADARQEAKIIINMPVKIPSAAVDEIIAEMRALADRRN